MEKHNISTATQYEDSLLDIINNEKSKVLNSWETNDCILISPIKVNDDTTILYYRRLYGNQSQWNDPDYHTDTKMEFGGIMHNKILYNPRYSLVPDKYIPNLEKIQVCYTSKLAETIAEEVTNAVNQHLVTTYPNLASIQKAKEENHWLLHDYDTSYEASIKKEAQKLVLKNKNHVFRMDIPPEKYNSIRKCIEYNEMASDPINKKHFIDKEIKEYLEKRYINEPKLKTCIKMLETHYRVQAEIEKIRQNMPAENTVFLQIKENLNAFLKTHPSVKNIKIILQGKDDLINLYTKRCFKDFSIEGKEITLQFEASRFLQTYENDQCFNTWNATYISPKLKERYSNRNQGYIDRFTINDILRIESGKTIIYQKE